MPGRGRTPRLAAVLLGVIVLAIGLMLLRLAVLSGIEDEWPRLPRHGRAAATPPGLVDATGSLARASSRYACVNSSDSGRDRTCFVVGMCYNHQRGMFVVDGTGTAAAAAPLAGNLRAADASHDMMWFPAHVRSEDLTAAERDGATELVLSKTLLVAAPLWPRHITHVLVNLMLPLQSQINRVESRIRALPPLRTLWTTGARGWTVDVAAALLPRPSAGQSRGAANGAVTPAGLLTGARPPLEGERVVGLLDALDVLERPSPSAFFDVFLVDEETVTYPVEALNVGRVYQAGTMADLAHNTTRCYAHAVVGLNNSCPYSYCEHRLGRRDFEATRLNVLSYYGIAAVPRTTMDPQVVLVQRRDSRRILNLDEVLDLLQWRLRAQVLVIELEDATFEDQARLFANADVVVAVHGNALGNLVWMKPHGHVIEIFQHDYWTVFFEEVALALDLNYHAIRCRTDDCASADELASNLHVKLRSVSVNRDQLDSILQTVARSFGVVDVPPTTGFAP